MVDNFNKILDLMDFRSEDDFYFLQIIRRKKENPGLEKSSKVVHVFYIKSKEQLISHKKEIIDMCNYYKARAYFNLNRRSFKTIALQTMKSLSDCIINNNYIPAKDAFNSCCNRFSAESGDSKKWIIDIDEKLEDVNLKGILMILTPLSPKGEKGIDIIETKNGHHLITKPFNRDEFKKKIPIEVDIHPDNPSCLFVP